MAFKEFETVLKDEIKSDRLSEADIFLAVREQIKNYTRISFTVDVANENKLKNFFENKVGNNLSAENFIIKRWSSEKSTFPYCEKLKSWSRKDNRGSIYPALMSYYWFHRFCETDFHAEKLDRNLIKNSSFKKKRNNPLTYG